MEDKIEKFVKRVDGTGTVDRRANAYLDDLYNIAFTRPIEFLRSWDDDYYFAPGRLLDALDEIVETFENEDYIDDFKQDKVHGYKTASAWFYLYELKEATENFLAFVEYRI